MKIQSRPPQKLKSEMTPEEIMGYLREVLAKEGHGNGNLYRQVLTLGALSLLKQLDVITDYQAREDFCGYYNIWTQVRTPDGETHILPL